MGKVAYKQLLQGKAAAYTNLACYTNPAMGLEPLYMEALPPS